jgi:4-amino-4-deoxy-L-arabinose transferase-like glycosyltransferase
MKPFTPWHALGVAIMRRPGRALSLLIATTLIARVAFASSLGLGVDESYTVATARHLALSYFDHPPAAWWVTWAARRLMDTESPLALRLPFILLFALSTWLLFSLTALLFGEWAGFWAAATLNLAPVIAWTTGSWILPDGPLDAALLGGASCVARALFRDRATAPLWWLAAGACGGLALLSKLHGAFLFLGVGLFLITSAPHRRWLVSVWPYAGLLLALAMFLPVLVWNQQHGWASFAFQAGRVHLHAFDPWGPLVALAGQALFLLPWVWLPLVICFLAALWRGPKDQCCFLLVCLAIGPIAVFTVVAFSGVRTLPHWSAPGYLMLFPLLGAEIAPRLACGQRQVRHWLAASATSVAIILAAVMALTRLPWPPIALPGTAPIPDPLLESIVWSDLARELAARGLLGRHRLFVTATRWHEAGKIDYALGGRLPVLCLCRDPREYGLLYATASYLGQDALIIGRDLSKEHVQAAYAASFANIEQLPAIAITRAGSQAFELSLFLARTLQSSQQK